MMAKFIFTWGAEMKTDIVDFWVNSSLACYFAHGETDGLTASEVCGLGKFERYAQTLRPNDTFMHWSITDEKDFCWCEACGPYGECMKLQAVYKVGAA